MKNKHLSFDDRLEIESGLKENLSFKQIAKKIERDCTTVSKEIRNHIQFKILVLLVDRFSIVFIEIIVNLRNVSANIKM